jgi:lipopolysaccharide export system permease protein
LILPIGCLVATIYVLNKLQQDREITAMSAAGLSNFAIARGPLLLGGIMTILMYINSAFFLPMTFSSYKTTLVTLRESAPVVILQEGVFTDITKGLTMFIEKRQAQNSFSNIFVHDTREEGKIIEIIAESGTIDISTDPPRLRFYRGSRSEYTPNDPETATLEFESYELSLAREYENFSNRALDYNEMPIPVLLAREGTSEQRSREMWAEGHYRLAAPLLNITLVIIGAVSILGSRYRRADSWRQIIAGSALAIIITIGLIIARSLTTTISSLFPLIYIVSILPALMGLYLLHQKSNMDKEVLS